MSDISESCIEEFAPLIQNIAGQLIQKASKENVLLSLGAENKIDDVISFYKDLKKQLKEKIDDEDFLINQFKICSILSLSLCLKPILIIENNKDLSTHYNSLLGYLVSEVIVKLFIKKGIEFNCFKEDFLESSIRMISLNADTAMSKTANGKFHKKIVFACILNLSHQYHLLYEASIEIK